MRTTKKEAIVTIALMRVYNKEKKVEEEITVEYVKGFPELLAPEYVPLETISETEKEYVFELSPADFFKHATRKEKE